MAHLYSRISHNYFSYRKKKKKTMLSEKEMATHSSVLAWRIPGTVSMVG